MNDPTVTPLPTGAVFAGIDWASADHAVCVVDAAGAVLWRHTVAHSRAGLGRLTTRLTELGVDRVGIERPDGPVVEALLDADLPVAVVPPRQVKNLRSRYRGAGKDDRFDAYLLADTMRTDGHRYVDLTRDTAPTTGLRGLVRARQDLVEVRVGWSTSCGTPSSWPFPARSDCSSTCTAPSPERSCVGSRPPTRPPSSTKTAWPPGSPPRAIPDEPRPKSSSTGCAPPRPD